MYDKVIEVVMILESGISKTCGDFGMAINKDTTRSGWITAKPFAWICSGDRCGRFVRFVCWKKGFDRAGYLTCGPTANILAHSRIET